MTAPSLFILFPIIIQTFQNIILIIRLKEKTMKFHSNLPSSSSLSGQIVQLHEPAQVLTATSINITWTLFASAHLVQGFYVKYKPVGSTSDYVVEDLATAKFNHYVLNNLKKFTTYEILLEPYSGSHRADPSNTIQAKTLPDTPSSAPLNLHIQLVNSHSLSIKWRAPPAHTLNGIVTGYRVQCAAANHTAHTLNLNTNATTRAILLANLITDVNYCVKVAAYNKVGTGPYTSVECVRMTVDDLAPMGRFVQQSWFVGAVSLVVAAIIMLCGVYLVWLLYKRRLHIKKSNSKKYLSNNSTLLSESRADKNGNRYKLVGSEAHVWLDTMRSDEANAPQYAEVYAPANPYATAGLFVKPEHNLYNILSYQQTMPVNSSSYTVKLLNEPEQKKLIKYLHSHTQSQTNTPKVGLKPMQHQQRVKSAENSQVTVNMSQQQLLNYLSHQYAQHSCQQGPSVPVVPVVPPPSLPHAQAATNNQTVEDYLNLEADNGQVLTKKFLFLNQNNLNSNEIYVSDEMVGRVGWTRRKNILFPKQLLEILFQFDLKLQFAIIFYKY
ncbi:roundabout -like protein [Brachionus plicatilis]|uniref:Roundabout-like protein n=1 Tax=Brachionus plicatilis TaxID=10195 RepID=A0A3M7R8I2_BRAPC|nr:roundabout -like protein [Brachionus plicatilis]